MIKVYSKSCEYVLRALAMIPREDPSFTFLAKDLCAKAKVPEASTRKSFQKLTSLGFLIAVPGPGGGYRLARKPQDTSLYSIILGIDGEDAFDRCIMGLPRCNERKPCPIHKSWVTLKDTIIRELKKKKLRDLMRG